MLGPLIITYIILIPLKQYYLSFLLMPLPTVLLLETQMFSLGMLMPYFPEGEVLGANTSSVLLAVGSITLPPSSPREITL